MVSARLAVPFMTGIVPPNDEFQTASRVPLEAIVRAIVGVFTGD